MKETFIRYKFKLLNSNKTGITLYLDSWASENMIEKYSVSFDNENTIKRITDEHISFGEKVSDIHFYNRLIRNIQSLDEKTREFASKILCDFLEFEIENFDLENLIYGIDIIINQIKNETNINVEQKLVEGLFEFIWYEKLSENSKIELFENLTKIKSYYLWNYLEEELKDNYGNLNSSILKKYYIAKTTN